MKNQINQKDYQKFKKCPRKKCKHYKPHERWLAFCEMDCLREFYYDPNDGKCKPPKGTIDNFKSKN